MLPVRKQALSIRHRRNLFVYLHICLTPLRTPYKTAKPVSRLRESPVGGFLKIRRWRTGSRPGSPDTSSFRRQGAEAKKISDHRYCFHTFPFIVYGIRFVLGCLKSSPITRQFKQLWDMPISVRLWIFIRISQRILRCQVWHHCFKNPFIHLCGGSIVKVNHK